MQSVVPLFDSPPTTLLPYVRPYPPGPCYPPYSYTGVGYGYGSPLQTTVPLMRMMQEHFPTPSDSPSSRSDSGKDETYQAMPPVTLKVFRPVDFERPCASKRETYFYEPPTPSEYGGGDQPQVEKPQVTLVDRELWESFNAAGNEMIVTKPGR